MVRIERPTTAPSSWSGRPAERAVSASATSRTTAPSTQAIEPRSPRHRQDAEPGRHQGGRPGAGRRAAVHLARADQRPGAPHLTGPATVVGGQGGAVSAAERPRTVVKIGSSSVTGDDGQPIGAPVAVAAEIAAGRGRLRRGRGRLGGHRGRLAALDLAPAPIAPATSPRSRPSRRWASTGSCRRLRRRLLGAGPGGRARSLLAPLDFVDRQPVPPRPPAPSTSLLRLGGGPHRERERRDG